MVSPGMNATFATAGRGCEGVNMMTREEKIDFLLQRFRLRDPDYKRRMLEVKSDRVIDNLYIVETDAEDQEISDLAGNVI